MFYTIRTYPLNNSNAYGVSLNGVEVACAVSSVDAAVTAQDIERQEQREVVPVYDKEQLK